jgi:hypothetical protein
VGLLLIGAISSRDFQYKFHQIANKANLDLANGLFSKIDVRKNLNLSVVHVC